MFNEHKIRKHSEWLERQSVESAEEIICEHYGVDSIYDLSQEQIRDVLEFRHRMNVYDLLSYGFMEVVYNWQNEHDLEIE